MELSNQRLIDEAARKFTEEFGEANMSKEQVVENVVVEEPKYLFSFKDDDQKFHYFSPTSHFTLSNAYETGQTEAILTIDSLKYPSGKPYSINFANLIQTNIDTKFRRQLKMEPNPKYAAPTTKSTVVTPQATPAKDPYIYVEGLPEDVPLAKQRILDFLQEIISTETMKDEGVIPTSVLVELTENSDCVVERVNNNVISITGTHKDRNTMITKLATRKLELTSHSTITYPKNWTGTKPFTELLIKLNETDTEYKDVEALIRKTLPGVKIIRVERIQNQRIWELYAFHKGCVKSKLGEEPLELRLFHGTRSTDPCVLYEGEGHDICFSNDGMWGRGNYFAVNASYSYNYAFTNAEKHKQFMVAKVIVGKFEERNPDSTIKKPSIKPANMQSGVVKNDRYDSIKGNTNGSDVYIVYDNHRAYPEYLVTFA